MYKDFYDYIKYITGNSFLLKTLVYSLDQTRLEKLFDFLIEGCQAIDQYVCQLSYVILKDIIHDLIFKSSEESERFYKIQALSMIKVMKILLILVLGGEAQNLSLISYPLLGVINLFKKEYLEMIGGLCLIQGPERVELYVLYRIRRNIDSIWNGLDFSWEQSGFMRNMKAHKEFEKKLQIIANNLKLT